jgi:hypothetical protein
MRNLLVQVSHLRFLIGGILYQHYEAFIQI